MQGLVRELRLRKRITQLQDWRMHGIRTLTEGARYEQEKKRRELEKQLRRQVRYSSTIKFHQVSSSFIKYHQVPSVPEIWTLNSHTHTHKADTFI